MERPRDGNATVLCLVHGRELLQRARRLDEQDGAEEVRPRADAERQDRLEIEVRQVERRLALRRPDVREAVEPLCVVGSRQQVASST